LVNVVHDLTERGIGLRVLTGGCGDRTTIRRPGFRPRAPPWRTQTEDDARQAAPGRRRGWARKEPSSSPTYAKAGIARATLYRHVSSTGEIRGAGKKLITR
jgi:hypothetical protein